MKSKIPNLQLNDHEAVYFLNKGAIHELELLPGGKAEWVIVPMKPGTYELHCPIAGHTEAGMTGEIAIAAP